MPDNLSEYLPNLICPGAEKAGTTTLYSILSQHRDIFDNEIKEPMFFNRYFDRGLRFYSNLYKKAGDEKCRMDFSVLYMTEEEYVDRIHKCLGPDIKIIILMRNPVDRFLSQFKMQRRNATEGEDDAARVFREDLRKFRRDESSSRYYSHGLYGKQVKWLLDRFPKENICFVLFEDMVFDPEKTIDRVLDFLELEEAPYIDVNIWRNKGGRPSSTGRAIFLRKFIDMIPMKLKDRINPGFRVKFLELAGKIFQGRALTENEIWDPMLCREIIKAYIPDLKKLKKLTGIDISGWIERYTKSL